MAHSVILGGSNAARLLKCPGSHQELMKTPYSDAASVYAQEGTALHSAIAVCLRSWVKPASLVGQMFDGVEITKDHVAVLRRSLDLMNELTGKYGGKFKIVAIEKTLALPGIAGAFGSVDLIVANKTTVIVIDWKFGAGVSVPILYPDGEYDTLNPQPAFYACGARAEYARRFRGKTIVLAIIQPRVEPSLSFAETDDAELDGFLRAFEAAVITAIGRDPPKERGEHCRFAACKATCELWTGPVLDLSLFDPTEAALTASVAGEPSVYEAYLSKAMSLAEFAEAWAFEIRKQTHVYLESGGKVPDWKLVPKRATRQWKYEEDAIVADLISIGADEAEVYEDPKLRSVAQMEKALKRRGIAVPVDLYHSVSTGTTIARSDDGRPEVDHNTLSEEVKQALLAL